MDTAAQRTQELVMKPIEEIVSYPKDRKVRPQKDSCLNCPRCTSTNTKFCYYNNYSLSQPRYFCKTCRRYWTEGGSLRNIPVGGGSRKNKKQQTENQKKKNHELQTPPPITQQNPRKNMGDQDLNLGFSDMIQVTNFGQKDPSSSASAAIGSHYSFLPLPLVACGGDPSTLYSPGFPTLPEFLKPSSLSFTLDGIGGNYGSFHGVQETNGKQLLFPLEDLKQVSGSNTSDPGQNTDQNGGDSNGIWSRVIGGGAW